jgi:metallo-beta-lactamase family protein
VTGSCHLVRVNGKSILMDCGLFQGRRADVQKKNETLPIDIHALDAVVLSHAHIDHSGRLPFLVRMGYGGPIHATKATRDLSEVMLEDSAHIQEQDAAFLSRRNKEHAEPLYALRDAVRTTELMRGARYDTPVEVIPGVTVTFADAGHILGSASVILDCNDAGTNKRLVFSGDIGRSGLAIIRDPVPPAGAHAVIMESTYGNRDHASVDRARERLGEIIRTTAARGGRVIVPAFAVGRTQELVYDLHQLANAGQIPRLPIVIDSPLATKTTAVFGRNIDIFDDSEAFVHANAATRAGLFEFPMLRFTESVEESKALNSQVGPMVIIAASGMAESGRILHHLLNGAANPRNTILVVGFMAEHTLGRRIVEKRPVLRVLGEDVPLRAYVEVINGYSAHADRTGLAAWIDVVRRESPQLGDVWLVHGEPESQDALAEKLGSTGYHIHCPERGSRVLM